MILFLREFYSIDNQKIFKKNLFKKKLTNQRKKLRI